MSKTQSISEQFVICISNQGYDASLEPRKIYQAIPDPDASREEMIRVIDESGEDYLYPAKYFVEVDLPRAARRAVLQTVDSSR